MNQVSWNQLHWGLQVDPRLHISLLSLNENHPPNLVLLPPHPGGASQARLLSLQPQSALRRAPVPPLLLALAPGEAHGLAPVLWSAVGDELPWMGLWRCQPGSESSAVLLSYWPCSRLLLPPFLLAQGSTLIIRSGGHQLPSGSLRGQLGPPQQLSWLTHHVQLPLPVQRWVEVEAVGNEDTGGS